MKKNREFIVEKLLIALNEVTGGDQPVTATTALIGSDRSIKSSQLVEFLLLVEELMEDEFDAAFDWTSESAMSRSGSIYRSIDALAEHLLTLVD